MLPLILAAFGLAWVLVDASRQRVERALEENARLLSEAIDTELRQSFAALQTLGRSSALSRGDLAAFHDEARDARDALGLWNNVLVLSPQAEHLLNLQRPFGSPLPPLPQPEGTLEAARTRRPYVSNVLRGRIETDWLMYIAYPVLRGDTVIYVLGVTLDHAYWTRWLDARAPRGHLATIIDRESRVVARTEAPETFVGKPVPSWFRETMQARTSGLTRGKALNDEDVVVAYYRSPLSGWTLGLSVRGAVVDGPWRQTLLAVIGIVATAILLGTGLALRRARTLSASMHSLTESMAALRAGRPVATMDSDVLEVRAAMHAAREAAAQLANRADDLDRAQQAARLGLWTWSPEANEFRWSSGMYGLVGAPPESFTPTMPAWRARIAPGDRARMRMRFRQLAASGGPFAEEYRIRRDDGREIWIGSIGIAECDAGGRVVLVRGVSIDITERKAAEASSARSELGFRTIADAAPAIVWVTDAVGSLLFVNDRWVDMTGQSLDAAAGMGWTERVHPDDLPRVVKAWDVARDSRAAFEGQCRYRTGSGTYRWHVFRGLPTMDDSGRLERWIGCSVDVHDAREAEEALREIDRRKTEFLALLAHELRNPLAPIRNGVALMQRRAVDDPVLATARDMIGRQVGHMVRLIDDLMDVSRISRGRLELKREWVVLRDVVEQALETARAVVPQAIAVTPPPEPVRVFVDRDRIAQVLANLLSNAGKYTDVDGQVDVAVEARDAEIEIRVRDTGIGLAADQLETVFEMFIQLDGSLSRSRGGLGIGLALARSLVELHGGRIEARSAGPGHGSTFVVRLPRAAAPAAEAGERPRSADDAVPSPLAILVVDDVPDNVRSLAALLESEGHRVFQAFDGASAIEQAAACRPDLIILDLGLPDLSGLEVCTRIRATAAGRDTPIVAMTGWGQAIDRERTNAAGFDAHLVKPVDYADLRAVLAALRGRYAAPAATAGNPR